MTEPLAHKAPAPGDQPTNFPGVRLFGPGLVLLMTIIGAMIGTYRADPMLSDNLARAVSLAPAGGVFLFAWHADRQATGAFFSVLAAAYLVVAMLDFMDVFIRFQRLAGADIAIRSLPPFQAGAGWVESLSLLLASTVVSRPCSRKWLIFGYATVGLALLALLLLWSPLVEGFRYGSSSARLRMWNDVATAAVFAAAAGMIYRSRKKWRGWIWQPLVMAAVLALVSQILAGVSAGWSGLVHAAGLCLKFTSLYLVFMAVVAAGLPTSLPAGSHGRDANPQAMPQDTGRRPGPRHPVGQCNVLPQSFLDGISEPLLLLDSDYRVVCVNQAVDQAIPSRVETVSGDTCHALLCGETLSCKECPVFLLGRDNGNHRFERRRGRDPERIEQIEMIPLSVNKDGFDGTLVRISDLTQSRQVERYLIHSEKMSTLGLLVSGIVHEINNPNNFITFNLPILRQYLERIVPVLDAVADPCESGDWCGMGYHEFRDELFSLLDNLGHGAERIARIVSNLKEMTHPRPAAQASVSIELRDVIGKAVTLCRNQVEKHVKRFEVTSPAEPIWLSAAPDALEQVLINLLINAAQAADKEESWIRLKAHLPETESKTALIEVHDNGVGIDHRHLERIFDPFFTTKAPGIGTGLGLSVSLNLMRRMGGHIDVRSEPGRWTAFTIHVPRCLAGDGSPRLKIPLQCKTEGDHRCEVT